MMRTAQLCLVIAALCGMVFADSGEAEDYSEYYKQYYEAHQAQERNPLYGPGSAQVRQDLATPENTVKTPNKYILQNIPMIVMWCTLLNDSL